MSITPVGGFGHSARNIEQPVAHMNYVCPTCHSSDWKMASLVYSEGVSTIDTQTRGRSLGIGRVGFRNGRWAVGSSFYRGRTSGVQQTAQSKLASPPEMRLGLIFFLAVCSGLMGLASFTNANSGEYLLSIFQGAIVGILMVTLIFVYQRRRSAFDTASAVYKNTRMCQRCGTFYSAQSSIEGDGKSSALNTILTMMFGFFILVLAGCVFVRAKSISNSSQEAKSITSTPTVPAPAVSEANSDTQSAPEKLAMSAVSLGYPVTVATFVQAYVLANQGQDGLTSEQLTTLAHDEYKRGLNVDSQTLLMGRDAINTGGKKAMDYVYKHDQSQQTDQAVALVPTSDPSFVTGQAAPIIRHIGGTVSPPSWLHRVEPDQSEDPNSTGSGGHVIVNAIIDESGHATHVHVLRGLSIELDEKAIESVRQSTFNPALDNGKPVQVDLNIDVPFKGLTR